MELLVLFNGFVLEQRYTYRIKIEHFHAYIKECLPFAAVYSLSVFFLFIYEKLNKEIIEIVLFIPSQGSE